MDKLIDLGMTKLFQLAEYVCGKTGIVQTEAKSASQHAQQETKPTIRFSNEDKMKVGDLFN